MIGWPSTAPSSCGGTTRCLPSSRNPCVDGHRLRSVRDRELPHLDQAAPYLLFDLLGQQAGRDLRALARLEVAEEYLRWLDAHRREAFEDEATSFVDDDV